MKAGSIPAVGAINLGIDMEWKLAHPLSDVEDIVAMAKDHFEMEVDGILKTDPKVMRKSVTMVATYQLFDRHREFLAVCRGEELLIEGNHIPGDLLAYCWFDRGGYTTYSTDEISNAKFHHVDLRLSPRVRVRLINEMIDQHILWANNCGVPVICSTSIRDEHDGFMRIHKKRGFLVNGSYAWMKTEDGMKRLTNV